MLRADSLATLFSCELLQISGGGSDVALTLEVADTNDTALLRQRLARSQEIFWFLHREARTAHPEVIIARAAACSAKQQKQSLRLVGSPSQALLCALHNVANRGSQTSLCLAIRLKSVSCES